MSSSFVWSIEEQAACGWSNHTDCCHSLLGSSDAPSHGYDEAAGSTTRGERRRRLACFLVMERMWPRRREGEPGASIRRHERVRLRTATDDVTRSEVRGPRSTTNNILPSALRPKLGALATARASPKYVSLLITDWCSRPLRAPLPFPAHVRLRQE